LPALPGTTLILAGLWLVAWADGFSRVSIATLALISIVGAATFAVDFVAASLGAKRVGASRRAVIGAALGMIAGLFFGLPGIVIGPFAGAVVGELTLNRDVRRAGRIGMAAWIGLLVGTIVKVGLAFLMIGIFLIAFLF